MGKIHVSKEDLKCRCDFNGNKYHPDNIPEEIRNSKLTSIWSNIYLKELTGHTGTTTYYIVHIKPSCYRKNSIIKFNALMRKYDWPCEASTNGYKDRWEYCGVKLSWFNYYRYVNRDQTPITSKRYKTIMAKAILSSQYQGHPRIYRL